MAESRTVSAPAAFTAAGSGHHSSDEAISALLAHWGTLFPSVDDRSMMMTAKAVAEDGFLQHDAETMLASLEAVCNPSSSATPGTGNGSSGGTEVRQFSYHSAAADDSQGEEVILYNTSITESRTVRSHCRQLELWLYLLKVKHHAMDVSENPFMRKRLIEACGGKVLPLPLLFVGRSFVGDFRAVEEKIEDQCLVPTLEALGYIHKPESFTGTAPPPAQDGDDGAGEDE